MTGNFLFCTNSGCDGEVFWIDGGVPPSETTCYGCGTEMLHMTDKIDKDYRAMLSVDDLQVTPHAAAYYQRQMDQDPSLPNAVDMWAQAGKPTKAGTYECPGGNLVIHSGPEAILFISQLEAKQILAGVRKANAPIQVAFVSNNQEN